MWRGSQWGPLDLTGDHAALIALGLGRESWSPDPRDGPVSAVCVLAAFIALAELGSFASAVAAYESVVAAVRSLPLLELAQAVIEREG